MSSLAPRGQAPARRFNTSLRLMRRPTGRARGATAYESKESKEPMVKVCGVTEPEDAEVAGQEGADFVGMVMWHKARRGVEVEAAEEIAEAARGEGAEPVMVFVEEGREEIEQLAEKARCKYVQLHGESARQALLGLPERLRAIYALQTGEEGQVVTPMPGELAFDGEQASGNPIAGEQGWRKAADWLAKGRRTVDYMLVDSSSPGSGETVPWGRVQPPRGSSRRGWILAGGLNPSNVATAVSALRPNGVDVSSGVCANSARKKSHTAIRDFLAAARQRS